MSFFIFSWLSRKKLKRKDRFYRILSSKFFEKSCNMPRSFYISSLPEDFSLLIKQKGRSHSTHKTLTIILFFSSDTKLFMQYSAFITNKRDFKLSLCNKFSMTSRRILTDADHPNLLIIKSLKILRKIPCLQSTSWSIILRIEIEQDTRIISQKKLKF